jgi:hypothetical protein
MKLSKKNEALNIIEPAYLASLSSLLWIALYYLPYRRSFVEINITSPYNLVAFEKRN